MSLRHAMRLGTKEFPEAFDIAENLLRHYEADCGTMTEKERYDFRRGFEIGYYFAKEGAGRCGRKQSRYAIPAAGHTPEEQTTKDKVHMKTKEKLTIEIARREAAEQRAGFLYDRLQYVLESTRYRSSDSWAAACFTFGLGAVVGATITAVALYLVVSS